MRRVLLLLVAAAVACVVAGLAIPSGALKVNHETLSTSQFNAELTAIDASPYFQCYLMAKTIVDGETPESTVNGVNDRAWSTGAAVEWANLRANQLATVQFVNANSPQSIDEATVNSPAVQGAYFQSTYLVMQSAASSASQGSFTCAPSVNATSAMTIQAGMEQSLPSWFLYDQVEGYAAASALGQPPINPSGTPLTPASLEAWYAKHKAQFDSICVSVIVSADAQAAAKAVSAIHHGMTFAEAATKYSTDVASAKKGGSIGCFTPNDTATWPRVVQAVGAISTGSMSQVFTTSSGYIVFSPTKRTPNSYASVADAVRLSVSELNQKGAEVIAAGIVRAAHIKVTSTLGKWVSTAIGGTIVPPASPPSSSVLNATANQPTT